MKTIGIHPLTIQLTIFEDEGEVTAGEIVEIMLTGSTRYIAVEVEGSFVLLPEGSRFE